MTTPEESAAAPPPPPAPVPMYHDAHVPQAMLSVTPGGPIPRWVVVVSVAYGIVSVAFGVIYFWVMLSTWS